MGQGWIEFLKNARRFHGNLVLLSEYGKQVGTNVFEIVTIGLRNEATQEVSLSGKKKGAFRVEWYVREIVHESVAFARELNGAFH